jgi:hypothetical protein
MKLMRRPRPAFAKHMVEHVLFTGRCLPARMEMPCGSPIVGIRASAGQ